MSELARSTGRGFLVIAAAKAWFLLTSTVVNLGLPLLFDRHAGQGSAAFGDYGVVTNMVSIFNMVMISGTLQAVAKMVSEEPRHAGAVVKRAMWVQTWVGMPIALAYFLAAPMVASALEDRSLSIYLQISAGIVLFYSFYAVFVGFFNGNKEFHHQAELDIAFSTLKTLLVLGAVLAGLSVAGALGGFVATALVMTLAAGLWVWLRLRVPTAVPVPARAATEEAASSRRLLGYLVAIMAYTFLLNAIIRADLFLLKAMAAPGYVALGHTEEGAARLASSLSGLYTGMTNVARLPYQGVIAITFVIFPIISRATFEGDREATRAYIRQSLRFSAMFVASLAVVLVANREALVVALYPAEYAAAGTALAWLSLGMIAFSVLFVATTILISAGRPLTSVALAGITLGLTIGLCYLFLAGSPVGVELLDRAALATMLATGIGGALSIGLIWRVYGASVPAFTLLRVLLASAAVVLAAWVLPFSDAAGLPGGRVLALLVVAAKMAFCGLLFYALLYAMREFDAADVNRLRSVFRRRRTPAAEG